jgi:hypothetical protein
MQLLRSFFSRAETNWQSMSLFEESFFSDMADLRSLIVRKGG